MGFFGGFFGRKPKRAEVKLRDAEQFIEKELSSKRKALLDVSAAKLAEIRHLLRETESALEGLGSAELSGKSGRLGKIVKTAKSNALKQLFPLLAKLEPPNTSDLPAIRDYCIDSILALQQAGQFGKNVAYAGISFKAEVKSVGASMKQLGSELVSLKKQLEENKAVFMQGLIKSRLTELKALEQSASAIESEVSLLEKDLGRLALEKSRLDSELKKTRESPEFGRIDLLNERKSVILKEKQRAKTELLDLFAKVEKPLHRLDKAAGAGKIFLSSGQAIFLHEFLVNPFLALKKDPKAETLKQVLGAAGKAVESGLIELKEKEREKKLGTLQELLAFDFFGEAFWKFNRIDAEYLAIEKELHETPAIKNEEMLLAGLRSLKSEQEAAMDAVARKKAEKEKASHSMQSLKQTIQRLLGDATGKEVLLRD